MSTHDPETSAERAPASAETMAPDPSVPVRRPDGDQSGRDPVCGMSPP